MEELKEWELLRDFMLFAPDVADQVIVRAIKRDLGKKVKDRVVKKIVNQCSLARGKTGFNICVKHYFPDLLGPEDEVSIERFYDAVDRQVKIAQEEISDRLYK